MQLHLSYRMKTKAWMRLLKKMRIQTDSNCCKVQILSNAPQKYWGPYFPSYRTTLMSGLSIMIYQYDAVSHNVLIRRSDVNAVQRQIFTGYSSPANSPVTRFPSSRTPFPHCTFQTNRCRCPNSLLLCLTLVFSILSSTRTARTRRTCCYREYAPHFS